MVGFASVLPIPSGTLKYGYRQHRLVILPDYQGLGFGTRVNQFLAEYYLQQGYKYFIRTTHIRLGNYLSHRNDWIPTCKNLYKRGNSDINKNNITKGDNRIAFSFEYVGEEYHKPHQRIICIGENLDIKTAYLYLDKIVKENSYPIIITGEANHSKNNIWEQIAREKGWRTEILFTKSKGNISIIKKHFSKPFDAIIIGKENQELIAQYRKAKDIRQLITYNYKKDTPIYYEKLITS